MNAIITPSERLTLATGVAIWLSALSLLSLTVDRAYLAVSAVLIVAMMLVGCVTARLGRPSMALSAQIVTYLIGLLIVSRSYGPAAGSADPSADSIVGRLGWLMGQAVTHMQTQSSPMTTNPGVTWLLVAGVGLMYLLADLLVVGLQRHTWAIAPALALFLIPAVSLPTDIHFGYAAAVVVGYLGILLAEGINRVTSWHRGSDISSNHPPSSNDPRSNDPSSDDSTSNDASPARQPKQAQRSANPLRSIAAAMWGSAALMVAPALVAALIGWLVLPINSVNLLGQGTGTGSGGPLQLADPTLDLRRNLNRPEDITLLTYRTTPASSDGLYLRLASLPAFSEAGWQNAPIQIVTDTRTTSVPGANPQGPRRQTEIEIGAFASEYLPAPYAPRVVNVEGKWGYDPQSLVFISSATNQIDRSRATEGLKYSVESDDITPDGEKLSLAAAGSPEDAQLTRPLPEGFPASIIDLTQQITAEQPTPALKAAAIQSYLRSDEFIYSTETRPGTGYQALTNFLFVDKSGYCEQFAAAMAAMARAINIPSRVAIGFLPGTEVSPGVWEVSAHDLHAWPELYFEELGWVRWEPTPVSGAITPAWTIARSGGTGMTTQPSAEPSASPTASTAQPDGSSPEPSASPSSSTPPTDEGTSDAARNSALIVAGSAALAGGLLAVPAIVRSRRRSIRLSGNEAPPIRVELAWDELRDTLIDYQRRWPSGSPRAIARQLASGLDPGQVPKVGAVAVMVEKARFSRQFGTGGQADGVEELVTSLSRSIAQPATRWQRIRATVFPRSLFSRKARRGA